MCLKKPQCEASISGNWVTDCLAGGPHAIWFSTASNGLNLLVQAAAMTWQDWDSSQSFQEPWPPFSQPPLPEFWCKGNNAERLACGKQETVNSKGI